MRLDSPIARRSGRGGHVLVVDDVPVGRALCEHALRDAGFEVETAADGAEALRRTESQRFDVILTDVCMPGLDGLQLLKAVRRSDADVPVILMTGTPDVHSAARAVEYGALRYLLKPIDADELVAVTNEAVHLHRFAKIKREALHAIGGIDGCIADRAGLEASFERALSTMWMAFQPIVRWSDRRVFGWEALMRSREPALPNALSMLRAAQRLHRLDDLGRLARAQAAAAADGLAAGTSLFVNLHPHDLEDPSLYDAASPLAGIAHRVVLEITERASLDDLSDLDARIARLRELGYRIALDDLGAGYASLNSFAQLAPDIVKIDMEIIRDVDTSPTKARVVESLATLCREMDIQLVGEGIETEAQRDMVAQLGCDLLQGFFFARPERGFSAIPSRALALAEAV